MSAIVEFPLGRARLPGHLQQGSRAAEVVIFPGVRIERWETAGAYDPNPRGPRSACPTAED